MTFKASIDKLSLYVNRGITPKYTEESKNAITVINQKCIRDFKVNLEPARFNDVLKRKITEGKVLEKFDVLINSTGVGTLGRVAQFMGDTGSATVDSHVTIVRPNQDLIDPIYFGYLIKAKQSLIESFAEGTTGQTELARNSVKELVLEYVKDRNLQQKIGSFLFALDQKIELNRQTNQTLEQIAQALFKSWFVDFDPVKAKIAAKQAGGTAEQIERVAMAAISGKTETELDQLTPEQYTNLKTTATLFPDELLDSELGDIPTGWMVKTLDEVTSTIIDHRGKTPKKLGGDWIDKGYPAVSAKNIKSGRIIKHDTIRFLDDELYAKWMKEEVEKGDILLTSEAPLGEMYLISDKTKYCLSQRLYGLRADNKNITPSFLYLWLQTPVAKTDLEGRATGTTVVGIRQVELRKVNSLVPSIEILKIFEEASFPLYEKLNVNERESRKLAVIRDALLPKLLLGCFGGTV